MNKKILSLLAVGAISTSMMSGVVASAAPGTKDVPVTYNNQASITDPDNPGAPEWQVAIPSGINFTEDRKQSDVSIELQDMSGAQSADNTLKVDVKVKSANAYKLKKGASEVGYSVAYGDKVMEKNDMDQDVTTLIGGNADTAKKAGMATLGANTASDLGVHTDTLTYTVEKNIAVR